MVASFSFSNEPLCVWLCFRQLIGKGEVDLSVLEFAHCDAGWLGLANVRIDAGNCTALELFASLGGEDDHSIFRVDLRRIDDLFLGCFVNLLFDLFLVRHKFLPSLLRIDASMHRNYQEYPEWH
jgi:hypothetical protein